MRWPPFPERFWAKVDKAGPGGCWLWIGYIDKRIGGYGKLRLGQSMRLAHRVAYELLVGPIPAGLEIDHLCGIRHCVNPVHLEAVDRRTNVLRSSSSSAVYAMRSHCTNGHPFDEVNTIWRVRSGHGQRLRECRQCGRDAQRRYQQRLRAAS